MVLKKGLKLVNVLLLSSLLLGLLFFLLFYGSGTITGAALSTLPDAEELCAGTDCAGLPENLTNDTVKQQPEELKPEEPKPAIIEQNQPVADVTLEDSTESGSITQPQAAAIGIQGIGILTAPVLSSLVLNTTNVSTNDTNVNLTAYNISNTATTVIYNWLRNSTSIAVLNMPFEMINNTAVNNSWDYSGYGNNGSADLGDNLIIWNSTGGYNGRGAYEFNGTGYLSLGAAEKYYPTNNQQFTFSLRFRIDKCSPDGAVNRLLAAPNYGISVGDALGTTCTIRYSDGTLTVLQPTVNIGAWYHLAASFNGSDWLNYLNGQPVTSGDRTGSLTAGTTANIFLGKITDAPLTNFFNGTIDEVMFFNRSLSAQQIHALFNNRTDLIASQETIRGENWTVIGYPNNGTGDGAPVRSNTVTILSTPPTHSTPILNTTNISSNRTEVNLTAYNVSTADTDNDIVKNIYNWQVDGKPIAILNMPFEGINNTATNNAWDYSGYGNNGSVGEGAFWNSTGGYDGKGAYYFNGTGEKIVVPGLSNHVIAGNFTLSFWMKVISTTSDNANPIVKGSSTTTASFVAYLSTTNLNFFGTVNGVWSSLIAGYAYTPNNWFFVSITRNESGGQLYINGLPSGAVTSPGSVYPFSSSSDLQIGNGAFAGGEWNGTIDDLMIFNRSLSAEQILALYNNRTDLIVAQETSKGNVWNVQITPNDGSVDGVMLQSNDVTILSTPPTHSTPILNTTDVTKNSTLTNLTAYNVSTADIDNDLVKNIYNWQVNGKPIAILNMPFEGINNTATNNAWDYSGYGNNGSDVGNVYWNSTGGYDGRGAYQFSNGSVTYLNIPDSNNLDFNSTNEHFTISVWAKHICPKNIECPDSLNDLLLGKGTLACDDNYQLIMGGTGNFLFNIYNGSGCGGGNYVQGSVWPNDTWRHVVGRYNGTHIAMFENGVEFASTVTTVVPRSNTQTLKIGGYLNSFSWNGTIDDLMIFNRSLSAEQIWNIFTNKTDQIDDNETSRGDVWNVQVTPNDGSVDGVMLQSNDVTILSTPPTHSTPILNTTDVTKNSTLTNLTAYNVSTADIDNDIVKNIYNWYRNGTSIAVLNMPFEGINNTATNNSWDYSGNGNHGKDNGLSILWNATGGYDGKGAYQFNGTNGYIDAGSNENFDMVNGKITISAWIKTSTPSITQNIVSKRAMDGNGDYLFNLQGSQIAYLFYEDGVTPGWTGNCTGNSVLTANQWYHAAATFDDTTNICVVYLNGVNNLAAGHGNQSYDIPVTPSASVWIGSQQHSSVKIPFNGTIDDVMIFNRSLSPEQILALFNNRTDIIAGQELQKNDVWNVQVTPNDGSVDGVMLQSNNVTILDKTPPFFVNITNPVNSSNFSAVTTAFNATVRDTESDLSRVLFMFNTNVTPFNVTATNRSGNWGALVNLSVFPEGLHVVRVFANDSENNINDTSTINVSFTVDFTAPNVSITAPATGRNFSFSSPLQDFNATIRENTTVVNTVIFQFSNGTNVFNRTATNTSGTWNVSGMNLSSFIEGIQNATVFANDTVNNANNTVYVSFTVDRTAPVITVDCTPFTSSVGQNVLCSCSATDSLSGVRSFSFPDSTTSQNLNVGAAGTFSPNTCTATDYSGNSGTGTAIFVIEGSIGGSSSGGGGGGSSSTVVGQFKKSTWAVLNPGDIATVEVENTAIGVKEVKIIVDDLVNGVWLEVRKENVPEEVEVKFKRKAYKTLEISASPSLKYETIQNAEVKFVVEKDWLKENQLPKENIAMFRYVELLLPQKITAWAELPTDVGEEDEAHVYYTAKTPGFSYFLIGERIPEAVSVKEITEEGVVEKVVPAEMEEFPTEEALAGAAYLPFGERMKRTAILNMDLMISAAVILFIVIMIAVLFGHTHKKRRMQEKQKGSRR